MTDNKNSKRTARRGLCGLALLASLAATGCQVDVAGQTLPSAYWFQDDVQYFAPGPDMKLAREAAAQQQYRNEIDAQNARREAGTRLR
ncbi:MAG: hypothetical protein WD875_16460 [Pirellulales bacterium]